jgi:hypothetical protein
VGPELILVLGDLEPAWTEGLAEVDLPKLGVRGNHDADDSFEAFGGSPRYKPQGGNQWTEEEAERMVALLPTADVLLTHSPPAGVNDEPDDRAHRGSPALRAWVERHEPAWLLHGHTLPHPGRAVHRVGPTRVVHVRGALPVELD